MKSAAPGTPTGTPPGTTPGANPAAKAAATRHTPAQGASAQPWEAFVSAKNSDEFCRAWLALIGAQIEGVRAAAVLVEDAQAQTFVPIATWPERPPDMSALGAVVGLALSEKRGIVQPVFNHAVEDVLSDTADANPLTQSSRSTDSTGSTGSTGSIRSTRSTRSIESTQMAYPVLMNARVVAVVVMDLVAVPGGDAATQNALQQLHWGSAWLLNMFSQRELELATQGRERVRSVLETLVVALRHGKFQQALFDLANELRQRFDGSRVAIGLVEHAAVKVAALSEAASFEPHSPLLKAYTRAMEEAFDHGAPVVVRSATVSAPSPASEAATQPQPQHHALLACSGANAVLSYPLLQGAQCLGVLLIERQTTAAFNAADLAWLDAFAALLAPIIGQRKAAEKNAFSRLLGHCTSLLEKFFGPRHLVWKAAAISFLILLALLVLLPLDYRVSAKTVIEGEVQRVVAAPFEGFIAASFVRAGDSVKAGQLLAQIDDRDLKIEQLRWASERDQYDHKLREALATADMTGLQVIGAQLRQSQAQLDLVSEKIARAQLSAPFDGLVVSGDLSQQIGSPVETGKKLFEIAPLAHYRIILQVDERDIAQLRQGQTGQMVITGIARQAMPLSVRKVTPLATAQDGKNFFRVEASLDAAPDGSLSSLRPGMEGVGKIAVGRQSLWWILTHSLSDYLRLSIWTWMP